MKAITALFFYSIFFLVNFLISYYIFKRGLQSIPPTASLRSAYIIIFWIVALSFITGRLLENHLPYFISDVFVWVGSFWLAAMLYFLLAVIALDLIRLINHFIPIYPAAITGNYQQAKYITGASVLGLVGVAVLVGHINSIVPRVTRLDLPVPMKASKIENLNIVAVSDIHLGTIVGRSRFDYIVGKINSMDPDLVLLPGDIVDEDLTPVIRQNIGESLKNLKSRYGVYAITGNHEYIGGVTQACNYLVDHNVTMLRDQSVKIADSFYLVGREDRSSERFGGIRRKGLAELMESVDRNYPVILMDHQPFQLYEAADQNIDLQISGHTHDGQLWPINHIVNRVYEVAWGYERKSNTHYYVSNGAGTWGPPVRLGNRPEIVNIRLRFERQ